MFSRASSLAVAASARFAGTLIQESTKVSSAASRITRCLRRSLVRTFPADDLLSYTGIMNAQRRWVRTSAMKTTPVSTQLQINMDHDQVDPELVSRYVVRPATAEDCADILQLIVDLAEWEGNADQVEITEEDLLRDGFGEKPCYQCVLLEAYDDNNVSSIIGYAMFSSGYCAWKGRTVTWEDLFLHNDYRGRGLGAVLLHEVCKMGYLDGCRYISGYVDFENQRAKQWYEDCGFENLTEQHGYNIMTMAGKPLQNYVQNHRPMDRLNKHGVIVTSMVERRASDSIVVKCHSLV